jgi:regulator of protease activity HflC (stomatin/prohibitin superfamily)
MNWIVILLAGILVIARAAVVILKQYERGVVLRLGRYAGTLGPGFNFIIPFVDKVSTVDVRVLTFDIPSQDVITRDNISVKVNGVLLFQVFDPEKAILQVENYFAASSQLAQTTLRSVCGEADLDDLLSKRDEINAKIQEIIDRKTEPFGVKVSSVEVKQVDLPQDMQRAMAKQAEAERLRRSKIIQAEGEYQAAERLKDAAKILSSERGSMQLRYLETLQSISQENNSTIIFPVPIDLFDGIKNLSNK